MSLKMLVTDDDPCLIGLYRRLFAARPDLTVDYAASPHACRALLSTGKYDLALLDISLGDPQEDGFGLLQAIRSVSPETDVLMMSSMDGEETVSRCLSLGARTFTSKNRNFPQRLRAQVSAYLEQRGDAALRAS